MFQCCCAEPPDAETIAVVDASEGGAQIRGFGTDEHTTYEAGTLLRRQDRSLDYKEVCDEKVEAFGDGVEQRPRRGPLGPVARQPGLRAFEVFLRRSGRLGMAVERKGTTLCLVRYVEGGTLDLYNKQAPADKRMRPFDFIVQINGQSTPDEMLEEVKEPEKNLSMRILRPRPFPVTLHKDGKPLGVALSFQPGSCLVEIQELKPGVAKEYNRTCPSDRRLEVGDLVVQANGASADPEKIIQEVKASGDL
eukprot:CAMPEP_0206453366 /NCGR_PEP_ID=MMETSP0324_2-20121206/20500_1 /ASSEMBLY_ACC=CAM_ASM_000836 /TAXON_ID=2866 /ORGANISM="Crypthecodinium cohnii, Strain Seligo" /LENGTH=249 /DNA_ID=CAMNT_0053923637 /DNA_START=252 /DNA_END=998 /DNA_ORIENTATION=-